MGIRRSRAFPSEQVWSSTQNDRVILTSDVEYRRMTNEDIIRSRFAAVKDHLTERSRRLAAAAEARSPDTSIAEVARATGVARSTIGRGLRDLEDPQSLTGEVRRPEESLRELLWLPTYF